MNLAKIDNAQFLTTSSFRVWPVLCVDYDYKNQTDQAHLNFSPNVRNWQQAIHNSQTLIMPHSKQKWVITYGRLPKKLKTNQQSLTITYED